MTRRYKKIPKFRTEEEERDFWARHDSTEYLDWQKAKPVLFSNLRPSTRSISIRLPESLLAELKSIANSMDVPYQSLIKVLLEDKVKERTSKPAPGRVRRAARRA